MRLLDPAGFEARRPTQKPFQRNHQKPKDAQNPLVLLGPNHRWITDGIDKFVSAGFGIWAIRDVWSGKWLGIWVVPVVGPKKAIAYLYLSLIKQLGGE